MFVVRLIARRPERRAGLLPRSSPVTTHVGEGGRRGVCPVLCPLSGPVDPVRPVSLRSPSSSGFGETVPVGITRGPRWTRGINPPPSCTGLSRRDRRSGSKDNFEGPTSRVPTLPPSDPGQSGSRSFLRSGRGVDRVHLPQDRPTRPIPPFGDPLGQKVSLVGTTRPPVQTSLVDRPSRNLRYPHRLDLRLPLCVRSSLPSRDPSPRPRDPDSDNSRTTKTPPDPPPG